MDALFLGPLLLWIIYEVNETRRVLTIIARMMATRADDEAERKAGGK